jgi:microcystin-dependent protein
MRFGRGLSHGIVLAILVAAPLRAAVTGSAGSGAPIGTLQPSLGLQVLIARTGVASGNGTGGVQAGGAIMAGEVRLFAGGFVPGGFLAADGQLVTIASAPELFSVIGTTYGGDGVTTFRVPDLRGRVLAGRGTGVGLTPRGLGDAFGAEAVAQSVAELPVHTHFVPAGATEPAGGGQPLSTLQPTLAVHPVITHVGIFQFLPEIRWFAGAYQPGSWMSADGRLLAINQYEGLFQIIGTAFGGDGQTTFGLPDLRGRVVVGAGTGVGLTNRVFAGSFGEEAVALLGDTPAIHSHTYPSGLGSTGIAGSGAPFPNLQPSLTLRWAIATAGAFPMPDSTNTEAVPTLGEIRAFSSNFSLPNGWQYCEGQLLPINQNQALFSLLETTFGGNGTTSFALPDLRGRTPLGMGQGLGLTPRARGEQVGTEATFQSLAQLAAHAHEVDPAGARHPGEPSGPGAATLLRINKNGTDPGKIDVLWGAGCASGVTGYAVYQGTLGDWSSHAVLGTACTVTSTISKAQTPCAGNCYYLVSAVDNVMGEEGSLGRTSAGVDRPRAAAPCRAATDLEGCGDRHP